MNTAESLKTAKGSKTRKPRKQWKRTEIEPSDNGGHIVTHHYERPGGEKEPYMQSPESVKAVFGSGPETIAHLSDHLGVKPPAAHLKKENSKTQPDRPSSKGKAPAADKKAELAEQEPEEEDEA